MDITTLQAFIAVAETGSFSRAAEQLFLTQPAVSKRIQALESDLDAPLFDRVGRRVRLTEAGRELLPRAKALVQEAADLRRRIINLSGKVAGVLAMGTSHHIGLRRLPSVLKHFSRTYPEVRLDIRFMDSEGICEAVEKGELELGVITLPTDKPSQLELLSVWEDPLDVAVGVEHPLAGAGTVSIKQLLGHEAVLPSPDTYTRNILRDALGAADAELEVGLSTNYLETLKMLAIMGFGWTLLPRTMQDGEIVVIRVRGLHLTRRLGIVTHRNRTLSNAAQAMITACLASRT